MTEGPDRARTLIAQRERWQRVIMETVFHYKRMFLNKRYGAVGLLGVPFFVVSEVIAPVFETLALICIVGGFALGTVGLLNATLMLVAVSFANAIFAGTSSSATPAPPDRAAAPKRPKSQARACTVTRPR